MYRVLRIAVSPAVRRRLSWSGVAMIAAAGLGLTGCAQSASYGSTAPAHITGSTERFDRSPAMTRRPVATLTDVEAEEKPRPVPPDPYKNIRYKGGRDPATGVAPNFNGEMSGPVSTPMKVPRMVAAPPAAPAPVVPDAAIIEVQAGDTLFGIARRHKVSVAGLMQANKITSPTIAPGQKLLLPAR